MPYSPPDSSDDPLSLSEDEDLFSFSDADLDSILSEYSSDVLTGDEPADPMVYARPWTDEDYARLDGDGTETPRSEAKSAPADDPSGTSDAIPRQEAPPETAPPEELPPAKDKPDEPAAGDDAPAAETAYTDKETVSAREKRRRRKALLRTLPFFLVLTQLTVVAWLLPLRPTYSALEKRDLATFPAFSAEALLSGDWFDGISLWFSDTFPGRENWVSLQSRLTSFYGDRSILFSGSLTGTEVRPSEPEEILPPEELPSGEPVLPGETTPEGETAVHEEAEDPAPTEELPADLGEGLIFDANEARRISSALYWGDSAYEFYGFVESAAQRYCDILSRAAKKYDGQCRIFSVLCPNSGGIVLDYQTYDQFYNIRQGDAIERFYIDKHDNLYPVYIYDTLRAHNDEYLYFRTDHHWTALAAWYAYEQWCQVAGVEPVPLSEYTELQFPGFLGSYYQHNVNKAMENNPDTVIAYQPGDGIHARYHEMGGAWVEIPCVVDKSEAGFEKKYLAFLNGDHYATEIINDNIQDDSCALVIKDSYANNFSIYLAQHYHTVLIRDWHYENRVAPLMAAYGIDDIFIVTELVQAQASDMMNMLYGDLTR